MRVLFKEALIVVIPETDEETLEVESWKTAHESHVLWVRTSGASLALHDLGERMEACREPINVVSNSQDPIAQTISNLASTPFELDGRQYQSVESFWQGLKFRGDRDRLRLAQMEGPRARSEGQKQGYGATVSYQGEDIPVGMAAHWRLMEKACEAKFAQNAEARAALLATGERPLIHVVRRDSTTIPGAIMAQIWMRIRKSLRRREATSGEQLPL